MSSNKKYNPTATFRRAALKSHHQRRVLVVRRHVAKLSAEDRAEADHDDKEVDISHEKYEYDIPDYSFVTKLLRDEHQAGLDTRHYMDAQGRIYFAARPDDFPLLHELEQGSGLMPWIVLLPQYITRQQHDFDFPYLSSPDSPWVTLTQNRTHKRFLLYASHGDFRPQRAVGVAFVSRILALR